VFKRFGDDRSRGIQINDDAVMPFIEQLSQPADRRGPRQRTAERPAPACRVRKHTKFDVDMIHNVTGTVEWKLTS
jgi:hypothetical protein